MYTYPSIVQDDYGSTVVVVTFAPDSFQETVTVPIVNDGTAEPPQRFYGRLAISNAEGVDLSDAVTSVNIIDDDGKCVCARVRVRVSVHVAVYVCVCVCARARACLCVCACACACTHARACMCACACSSFH